MLGGDGRVHTARIFAQPVPAMLLRRRRARRSDASCRASLLHGRGAPRLSPCINVHRSFRRNAGNREETHTCRHTFTYLRINENLEQKFAGNVGTIAGIPEALTNLLTLPFVSLSASRRS